MARDNFPRAKRSTTVRGYGWNHRVERKRWGLVVQAGYAVCVRCGIPIELGSPFHLDHRDDRLGYLGVSHAGCNLKAAARRGNTIRRAKYSPRVASREW
jgi:hypothetical protein